MLQALDEYVVHGIHSTIEVHEMILRSKAFIEGRTHTDFLDEHLDEWLARSEGVPDEAFIAAALAETLSVGAADETATRRRTTPWQHLGKWEIGGGA
jgi:acetyl/propionyl-CoA carboxylase alpha subunit